MLFQIRVAEDSSKTPSIVFLKEFLPETIYKSDTLVNYNFRPFEVDVNMIMNINPEWNNMDDYLASMTTKFRTKAKSCLNALIAEKVDLEKSCTGKTPLMYAAKYGNLDAAKTLIKAGAKLGTTNEKGRNALDYAVKYEQAELVAYFRSFLK